MYGLGQGEIGFKLKTRAACFLESEVEARLRVFRDVGQFYEARSKIVHGGRNAPSVEAMEEAFNTGFEVARRSVFKMLGEGLSGDWNEVVMAGAESHRMAGS